MNRMVLRLCLALFFCMIGAVAFAQVNYTLSSSSTTFTAITETQFTTWNGTADEGYTNPENIGFTFNYNGTAFTQFQASTNGFIRLGTGLASATPTDALSGTLRSVIAPLWDDLAVSATTDITYELSGTAGSQVLTVQWKNVKWNKTAAAANAEFQVKLYEATGNIEFVYGAMGTPTAGSASVGLADNSTITVATNPSTGKFLSINVGGIIGSRVYHQSRGYLFNAIQNAPDANTKLAFAAVAPTPIAGGTYTVGGSTPTFNSPSEAAQALNIHGIAGPVVLSIRPGTYDDIIHLINVSGTSATNTITIQKESGTVTLTPNNGGGTSTSGSTYLSDAIIRMDGTQYATIDGLTLNDNGLATVGLKFEIGIMLGNSLNTDGTMGSGGRYNTFKNLTIDMKSTTGTTHAGAICVRYFTSSSTETDVNKSTSYNTIENCVLTGFWRAAWKNFGIAGTNPDVGNVIKNCTIGNLSITTGVGSDIRALEMDVQSNLTIENNTIENIESTINTTNNIYGIWFNPAGSATNISSGTIVIRGNTIRNLENSGSGTTSGVVAGVASNNVANNTEFQVYNNKIYDLYSNGSTTSRATGIGLFMSTGTPTTVKIFNNMISDLRAPRSTGTPSVRGLDCQNAGGGATFSVYHNSVLLTDDVPPTNAGHQSAGIYWANFGTATLDLRNNIVVNTMSTSTGKAVCLYASANSNYLRLASTTDHNLYYVGATPTANQGISWDAATLRQTLADHQAAVATGGLGGPRDVNAKSAPVTFVSGTDLHLGGPSIGDATNLIAQVLSSPYNVDIDGDVRSAMFPYKGADEASPALMPKLAGDYYIPKGSHPQGFDSLSHAIQAFNQYGVSGTVRYLIDGDLLNEDGSRLVLTRNDLNMTDNLIIKPTSGKTPKISIVTSPTSGNASRQCFTLQNASWVTIDGSNTDGGTTRDLTISGNDPTGIYVIGIIENSDNVTLKNLVVTYDTMNTGSSSSTMIGVDGYVGKGVPENLLIENCLVGSPEKNLRNAVALWGNDASIPTQAEVRNNVLYANRRVITTFFIRGNRYVDNELYLLNPQQKTTMYAGIYLTGSVTGDTTVISRNKILSLAAAHTGATFTGGIVVYGNTGVIIAENNFITPSTVTTADAGPHSVYGVVFGSATWNGEIILVHNTIVIPNSAAAGRHAGIGWQVNSTASMTLYNNIISVEKDAAVAYPIHWPHALGTLNSDFNNLLASPTGSIGFINGATRKTLLDWQLRSGLDLNSKSKPVTFVGGGDFHLAGTSIQDTALAGWPIPEIDKDIDKDPRSSTAPYMGADEPVGAPIPPAKMKGVTIAESRKDINGDFIPDYKDSGDTLFIKGVITSPNYLASSGHTSYYIQDGTAATNFYKPGVVLSLNPGDLVVARGKVDIYRGLTEFVLLTPDSMSFQVLKTNQPLPAAKVITMTEFKTNFENYEGQVVRIDTLYKSGLSPAWPGQDFDANMLMVNAAKNDTLMVRIDKDTDIDGKTEPGYPVTVTGIATQYTTGSTVYTGGLQLQPRFYTDVVMVPMPGARLATTTSLSAGITNTGHIGSLTDFANAGGFVFGGANRLFEGALVIATDKDHVVSSARAANGDFNPGFKPAENITVTYAGKQMKLRSAFSDADKLNKIGIKVVQTTIADSTTGKDKYMIFAYDVINMNAGAVSGLRFGAMLDWDVAATANDRGVILVESNTIPGVNSGNPFKVYMAYVSATNAFLGVVPLTQSLFTGARIGINSEEVYKTSTQFSDSVKLEYISNFRATNGFTDRGTAEDLSIFFGMEPRNIPGGDTAKIAYALVAGATAAEFAANAKAAQADWIAQGGTMQILTDVDDLKDALPVEFALEQNYPNPFNPVTTIKFALPTSKRVSLKVYDLLGREVRVLIDKDMNAGYHQILWDSRNGNGIPVSSGMYIYQLTAGDFKATKKMMLLK